MYSNKKLLLKSFFFIIICLKMYLNNLKILLFGLYIFKHNTRVMQNFI